MCLCERGLGGGRGGGEGVGGASGNHENIFII